MEDNVIIQYNQIFWSEKYCLFYSMSRKILDRVWLCFLRLWRLFRTIYDHLILWDSMCSKVCVIIQSSCRYSALNICAIWLSRLCDLHFHVPLITCILQLFMYITYYDYSISIYFFLLMLVQSFFCLKVSNFLSTL